MIVTRYTWRTSRPLDRDAVCLGIFKYEFEDNPSNPPYRRSSMLVLEPEPHWHEYNFHDILPQPTVEIDGLSIIYLIGGTHNDHNRSFPENDPRAALEKMIKAEVTRCISAVMELEPAVTFDEKG